MLDVLCVLRKPLPSGRGWRLEGGAVVVEAGAPTAAYEPLADPTLHRAFADVEKTADGVFAFAATNTGLGLGDFMMGNVNTFTQQGVQTTGFRSNYFGSYIQDTWKISQRLTLNGGLRWDPLFPFTWKDGLAFTFTQNGFVNGTKSKDRDAP